MKEPRVSMAMPARKLSGEMLLGEEKDEGGMGIPTEAALMSC